MARQPPLCVADSLDGHDDPVQEQQAVAEQSGEDERLSGDQDGVRGDEQCDDDHRDDPEDVGVREGSVGYGPPEWPGDNKSDRGCGDGGALRVLVEGPLDPGL